VEQEQQDLTGEHFVLDLLVDKMGEEGSRGEADGLVVSLEAFSELHNQTTHKEFTNLGQLGVDNCCHGGIDRCEWQTGSLGLHDRSTKQTATTDQILPKQLRDDKLDVGSVDLVDQTVDTLLERLPRHALILLARLIRDLCLQRAQSRGWDICSAGSHREELLVLGLCSSLLLLLGPHRRGFSLLPGRR
jgi:hypothetical protein